MGCFDTVLVPCPKCGKLSGFQSKSGECLLRQYTLENCPEEVLGGVNNNAPNTCGMCNTKYYVSITGIPKIWDKEEM